jgi:1-acyl-sn-glycerol-3-phosphate acyltransferase
MGGSGFPVASGSLPRRGNWFSFTVCRLALSWTGWRFEGGLPYDLSKAVIIVAPHTSNWDFMVGVAVMWTLGIRVSFLGKHTLFHGPLGWLMRWLGGIAVDRSASSGVVEQTVDRFRSADEMLLGMSPEGTRSQVSQWKTGFYHIAAGAEVPIIPVALDYSRHLILIGEPEMPTGEIDRDIAHLESFYAGVAGKRGEYLPDTTGKTASKDPGDHIVNALVSIAEAQGERPALRHKQDGSWQTISWQSYCDRVMLAARGFIRLGLEAGDGVVIIGANRPEWFMADLAAIAGGGFPSGIYTTSTAEQCAYIIRHCEAVIAVVEDDSYLDKLAAVRDQLKAIVLMQGRAEGENLYSWQQLIELGREVEESRLRQRIEDLRADSTCSLIYTSGTTGHPKGVMLSHENVLWMSRALTREFAVDGNDRNLSYLPLSHIAEQVLSLYVPLISGGCTSFVESLEKLGDNLREVRPTYFFAVPRVLEKIQARMEAAGAGSGPLRKRLIRWARRQGMAGGRAEQDGEPKPFGYAIANRLVFSKVRARLGLDRARFCFTAAAPISRHTLEFFLSLGMPFLEAYGLSECTGPTTFSLPGRYRIGAAGFAIPGTELEVADDGELLIRGPHLFQGYFKDPQGTGEAIDADGWFHTGDIGKLDQEGFLSVTDRKKELIITSGGKNVAPVPIETKLRTIPAVSQAVVVGERCSYLTALLTLDPDNIPAIAARIGSSVRDAVSAVSCTTFKAYLDEQVAKINDTLAPYETIKRFVVLPVQLSVENGCLTPTMKLKRRLIRQLFAAEIEALYT